MDVGQREGMVDDGGGDEERKNVWQVVPIVTLLLHMLHVCDMCQTTKGVSNLLYPATQCQLWTSCVAILLLGSVILLVYPPKKEDNFIFWVVEREENTRVETKDSPQIVPVIILKNLYPLHV